MDNITVHLGPTVDRDAFNRVNATLARIGKNEQITITMESADAHQADNILGLLANKGFKYQPRGSHDGDTYSIIATKQ